MAQGGPKDPLPPYFLADTLESPLNWLKFTKKILGTPPFLDPGSTTVSLLTS